MDEFSMDSHVAGVIGRPMQLVADRKLRVLIVDDSPAVREALTRVLETDPEIEVAGTAPNARIAAEKIDRLKPDVLTLDIEMPDMDGLTFLRGMMRHAPMPVVVVSSHIGPSGSRAIDALYSGAIDVMGKPVSDSPESWEQFQIELRFKLKAAHIAWRKRARRGPLVRGTVDAIPHSASVPVARRGDFGVGGVAPSVIVIGASTGGPEAVEKIVQALAEVRGSESYPLLPPILAALHMPAGFTARYAKRLHDLYGESIKIREAADGDPLVPRTALICPGGRHTVLSVEGDRVRVKVHDGPAVNRHRPSVDLLLRSAAEVFGKSAVGILLTGMGADGADGLLAIKSAGGYTIAQDEASSLIFGMPKVAITRGAATRVLPLSAMGEAIARLTESGKNHSKG